MEKNQNLDSNQDYLNNKTIESDIIDEKLNYIKEIQKNFFSTKPASRADYLEKKLKYYETLLFQENLIIQKILKG
ncbi:MAG: hypothetical protein ACM34O_13815 [Ignavibacteria bacterium]